MSELRGRTVCIAGQIPGHTRESLGALLESHGVRLAARVSRKADYLVIGEDAPLSKRLSAYQSGVHAIDSRAFFAMLEPGTAYGEEDVVALAMASLRGWSPELTDMPDERTTRLALAEERAGRPENTEVILAVGSDSTAALRLARVALYSALDGRLERAADLMARATQQLAVAHPPLLSRIYSALAVCAERLGQSAEPQLAQARSHRHPDGRDDWPLLTALLLVQRAEDADAFIAEYGINERHGRPNDAASALSDLAASPLSWLLDLKTRWVSRGVVGEHLFISALAARLVREPALDRLE